MLALNSNITLENINIKKIKALHYCQKIDKISKFANIFIIGAKNM
jgi:hypothetical protein